MCCRREEASGNNRTLLLPLLVLLSYLEAVGGDLSEIINQYFVLDETELPIHLSIPLKIHLLYILELDIEVE